MRNAMKKSSQILVFALCFCCAFIAFTATAAAEDSKIELNGSRILEIWQGQSNVTENWKTFYVSPDDPDADVVLTSSDPSVFRIDEREIRRYSRYMSVSIKYSFLKPGKAVLTVGCEGETAELPCFCFTTWMMELDDLKVGPAGHKKVKVSWKKQEGVDGYLIAQYAQYPKDPDDLDGCIVKTVYGADTTSAVVAAELSKKMHYSISPFMLYDGKAEHVGWSYNQEYRCDVQGASVKSVKVSGKSMTVSWDKVPDATGYEIYRSLYEEDCYVKIGTAAGSATSFRDKPKAGTVWFYKVRPVFPDAKGTMLDSYAKMIPVKAGKAASINNKNIKVTDAYDDLLSMYRDGGSLCYLTAKRSGSKVKLNVFKLGSRYTAKKTKTVSVSTKGDVKGFYHGPDGNNYLIVTYPNYKDSEKKTVLQIIRFNKKWKRTGTVSLKGGDGFGIGSAVVIGRPAIAMYGNKLIIHTSRFHYVSEDGLRHESNLTVRADLKNMTADTGWAPYVSHSFAQCLRIKGQDQYFADRGDAYPRAINVGCWQDGPNGLEEKGEYETFKFRGETGDNYTGTSLNGMEIGQKNIVITGLSEPHNHPVKGVKGFGNLRQNLYVNVVNRQTGKSKVVWLTKYDPKKSKAEFGWCSMVKLDENRFAILTTINSGLHYYLIDQNGKVIKHLKYGKKMAAYPETYPMVHNGNIVWSGWNEAKKCITVYRIPAKL